MSDQNSGGRYIIPKGGKPGDAKRVSSTMDDGKTPNPAFHAYERPAKPAAAAAQAAPVVSAADAPAELVPDSIKGAPAPKPSK